MHLVLEVITHPEIDLSISRADDNNNNIDAPLDEFGLGLFDAGTDYELKCVMSGYPLDENAHHWTFRECKDR